MISGKSSSSESCAENVAASFLASVHASRTNTYCTVQEHIRLLPLSTLPYPLSLPADSPSLLLIFLALSPLLSLSLSHALDHTHALNEQQCGVVNHAGGQKECESCKKRRNQAVDCGSSNAVERVKETEGVGQSEDQHPHPAKRGFDRDDVSSCFLSPLAHSSSCSCVSLCPVLSSLTVFFS